MASAGLRALACARAMYTCFQAQRGIAARVLTRLPPFTTRLAQRHRLSCVDRKDDAINALSALMTSCFSLGQMIGPLMGSFMAARVGFKWASTILAFVLLSHTAVLVYLQRLSKPHQSGSMLAALTGQAVPSTPVGAESELAALNAHADESDSHDQLHGDADADDGDDGPASEATRLQRKWQS